MDQHQQTSRHLKSSLTVETSHRTSRSFDSVPLQSSSRLQILISQWNAKFTFIWEEDFGPLSNSPVIFLLIPGKMLLMMFLFQKWLGSPFPEDVWAWWLQLQFTPCEAFNMHLICFDTALCEEPHLSVMTLCDLLSLWRVSMIVFWTTAKSAVFPIIVLSKNKRYLEFIGYCRDGHLMKLKCKYCNILRYMIFDFLEL